MLDHMGDESVCELLEVGLGMLARARLSEGLRSTAQSCVQTIVRAAFKRLKELTPEDVEKLLRAAKDAEAEREKKEQEATEKAQIATHAASNEGEEINEGPAGGEKSDGPRSSQDSAKASVRASIDTKASIATVDHGELCSLAPCNSTAHATDLTPPPFTPYGLPTILELLRVLIALLNPSDQAHTDSMRYAALAVLNTALEVGGNGLGTWPELREGVRDEGCKYLFQVCSCASITW
jgi:brefeldin A-resistance guanine nucleotide exchange factor 1